MVKKIKLLITGSDGQLGRVFFKLSKHFPQYDFVFYSKKKLNVSNFNQLYKIVERNSPNLIINCAAFTDVDKAEISRSSAKLINTTSVENLANICLEKNIKLMHFSTDYIFDGKKTELYSENDIPNPIGYYGESKLLGEKKILDSKLKNSIIIRTSWLYSPFSKNFVNNVCSKINKKIDFEVYDDQLGSRTNAFDLAKSMLLIIPRLTFDGTEIFHYSGIGYCSRYELAVKINSLLNGKSKITPTKSFEKNSIRPVFSGLSCKKFIKFFDLYLKPWEISLEEYFQNNLHINEV